MKMKLNRKIKMLDLFAGCGGLTDGFMQTKCFNDVAAVEWKEPQVRTLRNRLRTKWGEQDADELGPCILDPDTRNVAQVTVEDAKKADELFEILMGTSVPPRREWLLAHSEEASDNIW